MTIQRLPIDRLVELDFEDVSVAEEYTLPRPIYEDDPDSTTVFSLLIDGHYFEFVGKEYAPVKAEWEKYKARLENVEGARK